MRGLTAVEFVGLGVLLGHVVAGIGDGVFLFAGLAGSTGEGSVVEVDPEGRGGGKQDVAIKSALVRSGNVTCQILCIRPARPVLI